MDAMKKCAQQNGVIAFADPDNCVSVDPDAPPISCRHCEGDGCIDGNNGELKPCIGGESSCIYVNAKVANKTVISRSCFFEATGTRLRGCVQVEEGTSFSGEMCYCDTDDCNVQTCDTRFCDCPYSDPMTCIQQFPPDDPHIIHCKVCAGDGCENGEDAKSEPCVLGEKSCLYGKTIIEYSPDNKTTIETRSCAYTEFNNIAMNGCIQVKEIKDELNGVGFIGDYCYCDTDDCNQDSCDSTKCDCSYSDPNNCKGAGNGNVPSVSFFLLTFFAFIIAAVAS